MLQGWIRSKYPSGYTFKKLGALEVVNGGCKALLGLHVGTFMVAFCSTLHVFNYYVMSGLFVGVCVCACLLQMALFL